MAKRWWVFFVLDRVENGSKKVRRFLIPKAIVFFVLSICTASAGFAAEESKQQASPTYDLEIVPKKEGGPTSQVQVGDSIELKISSADIPWVEVDFQAKDEGWFVQAAGTPPHIHATPLKPGRLTLPSLVLKDRSGKEVGRTHPFSFDIESVIRKEDPHPDQPEEIEPPLALRFPFWVVVVEVVLGLVLFSLLGIGVYYVLNKWKAKKAQLPAMVQSEDEVAFLSLAELESQNLLAQKNFKKYYFRLSEILKVYVGSRFQLGAPESTSIEILQLLKEKRELQFGLTLCVIEQLGVLFEKLDLVKFTDFQPELEEPVQILEESRKWIRATRRPKEVSNASQ